ncbi:hypothetical protein HDU82_001037 [Entophlyctis luteolus]|nr:hypothetical protein HDU82_001037 [Entophlyctis luteolus]
MTASKAPRSSEASDDLNIRRRRFKLPIILLILLQLATVLATITIPLGYISFKSSSDISDQLTSTLIQTVARESAEGIVAVLAEVVKKQTNLVNSDPAIDTIVQYYYSDFSVAQANFSRTLVHNMVENPFFSIIRVTFHPNLTGTQTEAFTPGIGMARVSCASAMVQSTDALCYARLYQSLASGQIMYARAVNQTTGLDIGK